MPNPIRDSLRSVRARLLAARRRAGRQADSIDLVAVTKYATEEVCARLAGLGQVELGESRAQALLPRAAACSERGLSLRWHFIGQLQRNKARAVVRAADVIHSIDSLRLLETVDRVAGEERRRPELYLQVDSTGEDQRAGFHEGELESAIERARSLPNVRLVGLMSLAPRPRPEAADPLEETRHTFARMASARARLSSPDKRLRLSMGMSSDFEVAIEHGSDLVRIGSTIVGPRRLEGDAA